MSCRSLTRWQRANRAPDRSAARRKARSIVALVLALVSAAADAARALGQGRPPQAALGDPRTDEDRPLVGDRPDFTESTETIPRGRLQVEGGYTFVHDRAHRRRVHRQSAPELLGRLGLTERWELRLGWSGYDWENVLSRIRRDDGRWESMTTIAQGANDMSIGAKVKLCDQADLRPHLGLIGQISVPSGSIGLSTGDVDLEVKLLWAYDLTDRFSLAGNVNLGVPTEDARRFVQASASVSLAVELAPRWGAYLEYFGYYPNAPHRGAAHYFNGGVTFLVTDDLQLDARAGAGLNDEADDLFAGVGFVWRF